MKSVKIVQSGDFHLDSPLALHHMEFRKKRREELLQAFSGIIDHSVKISADLLLLTGDIFDSKRVTQITLEFLHKEMDRFPGRIFISPGNHDPYTSESPYAYHKFPDNTHVFREYEEIFIPELDCLVCGQGFTDLYEEENQLKGKTPVHEAEIRILVMHGEVTTGTNIYNPITRESIERSGFSYIALGHRHDFSGILKAGQTSYAYAGIPEGRGFDELGDKGIIVGSIYKDGTNLSFRKMNRRSYRQLPVDVSDVLTTDEITRRILSQIEQKNDIYKITLTGEVPSYVSINVSDIEKELEYKLSDFSLTDRTMVKDRFEAFGDNTLKGLFMRTIEEKREASTSDAALLEEAANLGLRILSQEDF